MKIKGLKIKNSNKRFISRFWKVKKKTNFHYDFWKRRKIVSKEQKEICEKWNIRDKKYVYLVYYNLGKRAKGLFICTSSPNWLSV